MMTMKTRDNIEAKSIKIVNSDAAKQYLQEEKKRMALAKTLLDNIKTNLPALEATLFGLDDALLIGVKKSKEQIGLAEDMLYRFYHYSFKVYRLQETTKKIVELLAMLDPKDNKKLCSFFAEIVMASMKVGEWNIKHNKEWTKHTRPIVEAFFHAKYFLAMAVKYGNMFKNRKTPPNLLPSGWGALLILYGLR